MMKKKLSVLLVIAMMFSAFATAWADEEVTDPPAIDVTENDEDAVIARLYLCSNITVWPVVGHAWIYVENLSGEPIDVGYYSGVESGRGVSVGSFSFSTWDGWGIYYNLEAYRERNNNRYLYVSTDMTRADLDKLNNTLKSYPNYWGIAGNCATFAFSMWNSVTGSAYFSLLIPAITHFTLMIMGADSGEQIMASVEESEVKRQQNGQLVDIKYTNL